MKKHRTKLPIKTKVAVWWLITISVILTIYGIVLLSLAESGNEWSIYNYVFFAVALVSAFFYLISGILFAVKKRGTWVAAVVILSLITLATIINAPYGVHLNLYLFDLFLDDTEGGSTIHQLLLFISTLSTLIPLILAVSDVKNYWAMTEEVETSDETHDVSSSVIGE
jgi:hypothetical protein